jgi:hypothetical protein
LGGIETEFLEMAFPNSCMMTTDTFHFLTGHPFHLEVNGYAISECIKNATKEEISIQDSIARKVNVAGVFTLRSKEYRVGKGLAGEYVEIRGEENNCGVYFANVKIAQIPLLRV